MLLGGLDVDLVERLGLTRLHGERREELLQQATDVGELRLGRKVREQLSADAQRELDEIESRHGDVRAFLASHVSDLEGLVAQVLADLRQDLAAWIEMLERSEGE